jgi:hypothetical protein
MPSASSWIWKAFPDGQYWRAITEEHDALVDADYTPPRGSVNNIVKPFGTGSPVAFISSTAKQEQAMDFHSFWTLLGMEKNWQRHVAGFQEMPGDHVLRNDFDDITTLEQMHHYCQLNRASDTIVIHVLQMTENEARDLSKCLTSVQNGACNVCGGTLLIGPVLHFESSWVAKCSYIQKLQSPNEYVVAMNQASALAWVEALKDRLRNVPESPDCLFIDSHALRSWVTSHPDVVPCQLPSNRNNASTCFVDTETHDEKDGKSRLQAYSLLAGHLWRWSKIYGQAPSPTSWVWTSYPDGEFWRQATNAYGVDKVVESVTHSMAETSIK